MPSRKILVILIICLGLVGAVWILQQPSENFTSNSGSFATDIATTSTTSQTSVDWQNILSNIQSTTTVVSGLDQTTSINSDDDTTMTFQLAKDFFSRYLLAQGQANQNGVDTTGGLDQNTSDQIVSDVLSSGSYTNLQSVVYTAQNLNIEDVSTTTIINYFSTMKNNFTKWNAEATEKANAFDIFNTAVNNQDQNEIKKLDPIIERYNGVLLDLLKTPVPEDAVEIHLGLVNAVSSMLTDLKSMRILFVDPVKSLVVISNYQQHTIDIKLATEKLQVYFKTKSGGK